jgi:hypothetical protein
VKYIDAQNTFRVASMPAGGVWSAVGLMPGIKFTMVMPDMPCNIKMLLVT